MRCGKKELPIDFAGEGSKAAKSRKSERNMPRKTAYVADYLENHRDQILKRWRRAAKQESKESKRLAKLDDEELMDHIPAITEAMIDTPPVEPTAGERFKNANHE